MKRKARLESPISTSRQILLTLVATLTILSPGMSMGWSGIALPFLADPSRQRALSKDQSSWVASISSIATPLGCLVSGPLLDRYGRKKALYSVNIFMIVGWLIIALADNPYSYSLLLLGRFITGIGCGLSSIPATVYASEISTPKLRGMLATWITAAFTLGVLLVYIFGYFLRERWTITAWIAGATAVIALAAAYQLLPESPLWSRNRNESRKKTKEEEKKPETEEEVELENGTVENDLDDASPSEVPESPREILGVIVEFLAEKTEILRRPECLKPLLIMSGYFFFQQFSGTFVMIFYAVDIVTEAGIEHIDQFLIAIVIGGTRTLAALLSGYISKKYGRRPPSIASGAAMTLCMIVIAEYLYLPRCATLPRTFSEPRFTEEKSVYEESINPTPQTASYDWLPISTLILYFSTSTLGFLSIPFAMIGEIYPESVRGLLGGLTSCICYTFGFFVIKLYPAMLSGMTRSGLFLFYGIISFLGTIFVLIFLPETKGKSLSEIESMFQEITAIDHPEED